MLGLTVIYLPIEVNDLTLVDACVDKELIKRLNRIVFYWTKQVKHTLTDLEQPNTQTSPLCVDDEYQFWISRWNNLCGLSYQLKNSIVEKTINILIKTQSIQAQQFMELKNKIEHGKAEAKSNIEFLEILRHPCSELFDSNSFKSMVQHLPRILYLFRFIWLNSPFYSIAERTYHLIKLLNNQIIITCSKFINLDDIFEKKITRKSISTLRECIQVCEVYKELYLKFANAQNTLTSHPWDLNVEEVFTFLDTFISRCGNLIEICQAMIDFARLDETIEILSPVFSGTEGVTHGKVCTRIEKLFLEHLQQLKQKADKILNVQDSTWNHDMFKFRNEMKELDMMIENLVNKIFRKLNNIREGISNLYAFHTYRNRENLKTLFDSVTTEVWRLFTNYMQAMKQEMLEEKKIYPFNTPYFAGRAINLHLKRKRLDVIRCLFTAAKWMDHCSISEEVYHQHEMLVGSIRETIAGLYRQWLDDIGDNPKSRLDRYLMRRSDDKPGLLESNLDPDVLNLCSEANYWQYFGFQMPLGVEMIYDNIDMLQFVSESILTLVLAYNRIIEAFSPQEKSFFRYLIKNLDSKIQPGLSKLTWNSEYIEAYVGKCCEYVADLQNFIDTYKQSNLEIMKICEQICNTSIIEIKHNYGYELLELQNEMETVKKSAVRNLEDKYINIIQYLLVIYEGFEAGISESTMEWKNYLINLDTMLEEAFKLCLKNSLNTMYYALHGDGINDPSALLVVQVNLIDNRIILIPPFNEVSKTISSILQNLLEPFKSIRRLPEKFGLGSYGVTSFWRTFKEDETFIELQKKLDEETSYCFNQVQIYFKTWELFNDIWNVDKDIFIKRYETLRPNAVSFDAEIKKYEEVANDVQNQESVMTVHFLDLNSDQLKTAIIEHCSQWQQKLTTLLFRMTQEMVEELYKYIEDNQKRITEVPKDLISMQTMLQLFERLQVEVLEKEEEFPRIREQYQTLEKYEVPLTLIFKRKVKELEKIWAKYLQALSNSNIMISESKEHFKNEVTEHTNIFQGNTNEMTNKFYDHGPFTSEWKSIEELLKYYIIFEDALNWLKNYRSEVEQLEQTEQQLKQNHQILELSFIESTELMAMKKDLFAIELIWQLTKEWDEAWERYKTGNFWIIEIDEMEITANKLLKKLKRLSKELRAKNWQIIDYTTSRVDQFRRTLPLIIDLKNPAMRDRHWDKIKIIVDQNFDEKAEEFTLDAIVDMRIHHFAEEISDISNQASMELGIELNLNNIIEVWEHLKLSMTFNKERAIYRLHSTDDIFQLLEDHQVQLSAMKSTRFVEPFAEEVDQWERTLSTIGELLEIILVVQKEYMYLDNVFHTEDIRKQLPKETVDFDKLMTEWKNITTKMAQAENILDSFEDSGNLLQRLNELNTSMESIQRSLEEYLENKRHIFPRFYFISNDDLLEILGHSKRPDLIQPHINKLFGNIKSLKITKSIPSRYNAEGMFSSEGEHVKFLQPVVLEGLVEHWLCKIEMAMRDCLREVLRQCRAALRKVPNKQDKWVKEWPSQSGITSSQIQWTSECTRALVHCKLMNSRKPLKKLHKKQNRILAQYTDAIRSDLDKLQRVKFKAIIVIQIHARDVIEKMYKNRCKDVTAFEWISQLRFYWDKNLDNCVVRQTNTYFVYGYEYLGNSERLVITPLTDRCYITLTTALHLCRGGSPKGPAGTGKTETVKDLGKALGFNVIVQNCSESLDYKSMGRLFSGLVQTGAWGCFDEFNRINIEVLSVIAQQILSIFSALSQKLTRFLFEGVDISLVPTCGIFITMNPGYAGRTELPDNLQSMFRPIAMMVPDSSMIAEINLFAEGFENTRALARKVFTLYTLAQQQLSKQHHYDFGLRGIVTLTRYAGKKRRQFSNLPDEEIIILSMKDMNKAKLTADDLPLFTGITSDLFPDIQIPSVDYDEFFEFATKEAIQLNLQPVPMLLTKVVELYETKNSRHSTMIVGQSNTGKSATWKVLKNTMTTMKKEAKIGFNAVYEYPINPKALNLGELYGEYNLSTGEWSDGVISSIMRKTCADDTPDEKWILFDGPVDALWIENMNSVMDDNKILTLINNERITLPHQVSLLFEVQDLAVASPATVSRAGMIYHDYKDLGWHPLVNSWLDRHRDKPEFVEEMDRLFKQYVDKVLTFKKEKCHEIIPVSELNAVESLCKLLEVLATPENGMNSTDDRDNFNLMCKLWFLFCMVWSLCASVDEEGRQRMDNYIREMEGIFPLKDTIYEYYVDVRQRSFISWEEELSLSWRYAAETPFHKIIVPTIDTVRYNYLTSALLRNEYPVLLIGPIGTGKTSTAQSVFESLDRTQYSLLVINMSGQTTSRNIQEAIGARVEKRTKGIYVPPAGKKLITFMDDFNMPSHDTYGSQPPLELIRQWIDYKFWYNCKKQSRKYIKNMQLMAAMGPPGGGRNEISNRLLTKFNVINMTLPTEKQIARIYSTMLNQHLFDFHTEVKKIANEVTLATINMYNNVVKEMLPTPGKVHYLFNLRDISKVFQGLLRSHRDYQYSRESFLRLWIHEVFRVFSDRLIDEGDRDWFISQLNEQLGKYFELTFHNLCPEKRCPIFGSFINAWNIYEDLKDIATVRRHIEVQIEEYNTSPGAVRLDLVLFRDAIDHICRIIRIISQPRGNVLLVGMGGNGRQSLSKVASYMVELKIFQIEVTKHYRILEFREDLKRLYAMTGVDNKPTTFLFNDTQVMEEQFLEIINNMLGTGEVANLYKTDEMEEIKKSLTKEAVKAGISPTPEAIYLFFLERVRSNVHIVLSMNPIGENFRNYLRHYPAIINCTTIDWFLPWPKEALLEVGNKFLMNLNLITTITGEDKPTRSAAMLPVYSLQDRMVDGIASTFASVHESVIHHSKRMAAEMKRYCYVTPTNFLELVVGYKKMLEFKRQELADQANKLNSGLHKIDDTRKKVNEMAEELEVTQQQVLKATKDCEEYLITIVNQRRDTDEAQKSVTARSIRIEKESKECKKLEQLARADLETVEPALDEAMKALDTLNKKDLAEIKSFSRPPPKVEIVMEAVMILKNSEPTWVESKRQLGDVNFLSSLRNFDKDHISDRTLKAIGKYTSNPEFIPEKVGQVSIAAKSLCMWVIAMEQYGKLYRIVAPKRKRLESALKSLQEKEKALNEAVALLQQLRQKLENLQQIYDTKIKEKEDLIRQASTLSIKLERARLLVDSLSGEHLRWQETVQSLRQLFDLLPGNCLISSAFVSYLGPFVSNYREELVEFWMKEIQEKKIPHTTELDVKQFLTDPTTIREWNIQGLPSDEFSTENGIIITQGTRWPLVIDPQCQAVKWIKNMEAPNNLRVIDLQRRDFIRILEQALQFGEPLLLENVGEHLDPILNPILNKKFIKLGNSLMIKFNDKMISYNDNFRLYITTKLANPHYAPEISTKTTLCNFAIKEQGLETQLLGIVVRKEKPQLEQQKDKLVLTIASNKRLLIDLEDKILHLLNITSGSLLDDLDLLNTLQTSKVTATSVEESLIISEQTEKEIDEAREEYRPCSKRATILFFVLNDMSLIDPMYQFSLESYINLFQLSIDRSPKHIKLNERINSLNEYHTYLIYKNTCRGLFEQHKLLFSFHMCVKILEAQGKMVSAEYNFLLKGGIVLDRENQPDKPVNWLPDESWDNISELDKLPGFHGVVSSFEQFSRDWHNWYINTEPETISLPGEWNELLTDFQKMLIIRSCRADRITFCVSSFIRCNLGAKFVEPPSLDLKAVLDNSVAQSPLIFVLSPGVDPTGALMQFAEHQDMSSKFMTLSLGQGQSPIATRMIEVGSKEGCWVFLANCHLSLSWMPTLDKIIEALSNNKNLHPDFRLWLSSSPTPQFPISILQAGLKMTTEPPRGLKANMKRLYSLITENQFDICRAKEKYQKLLFTLVFFHSVLLERKKFRQLGWNVVYSFNDSDFEVSENLLQVYLDEYPDTPWNALKYLIAGVCYGGHVTDDWDRRLLMTYVQQYFTEDVLTQPFYRLSSSPIFYVPRNGSLDSYRDFIEMLPNSDKPDAFGQHMNADITSSIIEAKTMFSTLMSLQIQVPSKENETTKEDKVMQLSIDMEAILPKNIDYETTAKLIGPSKSPLSVVLLQEIARYNILLEKTRTSLRDLQRGIKGLILMSEELEEIFTSLYEGRVPSSWLEAYPSLKPLGSWTQDLISRVEHFAKWAETTRPPMLFWLAAYTFPTSFLTAVLQTSARLWNISIDSLTWEFNIFTKTEATIVEEPTDGVYIRSIFLEGARWDWKNGILIEPTPMQLICDMPVIHFLPCEQSKKKSKEIYACPCYYYPLRSGTQHRPSFVVAVDLKSGHESPNFWVKRGTALLLSLSV
ncbi:dynein heavy chain 2, axonemal [Chelonus insularis]|uniref:dynein heavy chain 2, axonemal n=1 Tax=Chelonus insularis TaxID=460826 RepID=UPI0015893CE8|nr:dynein heavy chain 2, axonemal [Chelonus insularis]